MTVLSCTFRTPPREASIAVQGGTVHRGKHSMRCLGTVSMCARYKAKPLCTIAVLIPNLLPLCCVLQLCTRANAKVPFSVSYPNVVGAYNSPADDPLSPMNPSSVDPRRARTDCRTALIWSTTVTVEPAAAEKVRPAVILFIFPRSPLQWNCGSSLDLCCRLS
jgi:hypothetical protein